MRNVNRIVGRDGVVRLYFRKRGAPSVPLRAAWGTSELETEVAALLAACEPDPTPGTLRQAVRAYEGKDANHARLAESTRYEYGLILREFNADFGELPLSTFTPSYILRLRDAWAPRGHRAANVRLIVLRNVLKPWIIRRDQGDPFALIEGVRRPPGGEEPHSIWPEVVVRTVIEAAIVEGRIGLARGVAIGRYAGARRGDIVRLTRAARQSGRFSFISGKRRVPVSLPEDTELTAVLNQTPNAPDSLVLAYSLTGVAYTEDGFALELQKLLTRLKAARAIPLADYTIHGLRHTFGVESALAGCTDAQGAARMGHTSPGTFAIYRRQADRIRMSDDAALLVRALRERGLNGIVQNEVQNPCKTIPGLKPARLKKNRAASKS